MEPKKDAHTENIRCLFWFHWNTLDRISVVKILAVVIELVDCVYTVHFENYEKKQLGFGADVKGKKNKSVVEKFWYLICKSWPKNHDIGNQ